MQGFQSPGIRRLCQIVPYDFFLRRWGQWNTSKERPFHTPFGNVAPFPTRGATCRLLRTPVRIVAQAYPQILNNSTSSHTILGLLIHTVCDCCSPSSEPTIIVRSIFVGPVWLIGCSQSDFLVQWGPFLRSDTETDFPRPVRSAKRLRFVATVFVRSKPVN